MNVNHILFGCAYYDEYMPCDRIEQDMSLMQKAGINVIRIAESTWSTLEPQEGVFDFTHIDRMIQAAAHFGIEVIVGTPTYAIPTWLVRKSDDMLVLSPNGQELYGHRQNMDITNPVYLKYSERIIRTLLSHIQDCPNVIGFQIDNETHHYNTCGPRVQQMFVTHLKEKYPDIRNFNKDFGLDYWSNRINTWEDFPDIRGTINGSLTAEFERFQRHLVTNFFAWQADIIKEYKRHGQFITHNFDYEWHGYSFGLQPDNAQFASAEYVDTAGCDIYHPAQQNLTGAEITFCGNIARGLKNENYLVLETQAQGTLENLPYPGQLRLCAYSHIMNGAGSVMYWHWHSIHNAIESYWKGILSHDFSCGTVYQEIGRIGSEFLENGSMIQNLKKKNIAAVMVDNSSLSGLKQFPFADLGASSYNTVVRWLADSLYRMNIEYDIIPSSARSLSQYKLLLIPALYSATNDTLHTIEHYVADGGTAVISFRSGFSDEHLQIYSDTQPHILRKCLGIHYDLFTVPGTTGITFDFTAKKSSYPLYHWMELITPDTALPVGKYTDCPFGDYAAVTSNQYEKGTAYYLGTFFDDAPLDELMRMILKKAGICIPDSVFPLIIKQGVNENGRQITAFLNYSASTQIFTYPGPNGTDLLVHSTVSTGDTIELPAWGVLIIAA